MEIRAEKDVLSEVGQAALRVVSPRATLPALGGVKISSDGAKTEVSATDLEVFLTMQADVSVDGEGTIVVPGRLFGEILKSVPQGTVVIRSEGSEVTIEGGRSRFSVSGFSPADFPETPKVDDTGTCEVVAKELAAALRQVVIAASPDEARPTLTGVLWSLEGETLKLVATDSYRLAVRELGVKESPGEGKAIIPGRALAEFARQLASGSEDVARVELGESQAALLAGGTRLVTRLIEGEFPNYRQLIPEGHPNRLTAPVEAIAEVVERVGIVAQMNTPVRLHLGDEVEITATETGVAEASEVIDGATYEGEPQVVAFNPRFLADGLSALGGGDAQIDLGDAQKPALITTSDIEGFTYLLMPVRLP